MSLFLDDPTPDTAESLRAIVQARIDARIARVDQALTVLRARYRWDLGYDLGNAIDTLLELRHDLSGDEPVVRQSREVTR
jgi:hypothetical protein